MSSVQFSQNSSVPIYLDSSDEEESTSQTTSIIDVDDIPEEVLTNLKSVDNMSSVQFSQNSSVPIYLGSSDEEESTSLKSKENSTNRTTSIIDVDDIPNESPWRSRLEEVAFAIILITTGVFIKVAFNYFQDS